MKHERVAVITGGSKGIGLALVKVFLAEGFRVYTASRSKPLLSHPELKWIPADLSSKEDVIAFGKQVAREEENVEVLVNNVGVFIPGSLMSEDDGVFETQLQINLASGYHLTRVLIDLLRKAERPTLFNICSTASITPYPNGASYCISKYAQLGMTKVLREELKQEGIRVCAVLPGATLTDSWAGTDLPPERFLSPEDVANSVLSVYSLPSHAVVEELLIRPQEGDID